MHGIVVATDLSPAAQLACQRAAFWARRFDCDLHLLHVVHDPELAPALAADVPGEVQRARAMLERLKAHLGHRAIQVHVLTAEDPAAAIVAFAANCRAEWLFVGTHGRTGVAHLLLGSVAARIARTSSVPVVCCPASGPPEASSESPQPVA